MNTILQKRIEEKSKELAQKYFPDEMNIWARQNYEALYVESACKEITTFALQNQWISVEEALPELPKELPSSAVSEIVLIKCSNGAITRARYVKILGDFTTYVWQCVDAGFNVGDDKVTHWMSIPKIGGEK